MVNRELEDIFSLRTEIAHYAKSTSQWRAGHPVGGDADRIKTACEIRHQPENPDGAGDRCGFGENSVRRGRNPIATRGCNAAKGGHHRSAGELKCFEFFTNKFRCESAASG